DGNTRKISDATTIQHFVIENSYKIDAPRLREDALASKQTQLDASVLLPDNQPRAFKPPRTSTGRSIRKMEDLNGTIEVQ
ncbi:MAG TPA: hypothetical protein VK724_24855, partial [Bryobacteraceae bacterium]|nr:hypothetical protein [Bryobacteraceae bacterium]